MNNIIIYFIAVLFLLPVELVSQGHLFMIGGGTRTDYMMERFIELAGGKESKFIIFPNASSDPIEAGEYYMEEFNNRGVKNVDYIVCTRATADMEENFKKLQGATGIFFSGGDQSRHTVALLDTRLLEKVKNIYNNGGIIGGTSAGAAVMSQIMITGDEMLIDEGDEPFSIIKKDNIVTAQGFGFIDEMIIDQHFVRRKRHNRLVSLVLEYPNLVGAGIDESTALIKNPDGSFDIIGEYTVVVYDAREAQSIYIDENGNLSGRNIKMHILKQGDRYYLNNN